MDEFFSWTSLATLGGATIAVVVVTNTARKLLKWDTLWIPFVVSVLVLFGTALSTGALTSIQAGLITFLNSCLLFCTALGINDTVVTQSSSLGDNQNVEPQRGRKIRLFQTWIPRSDDQ